MTIGHLTTLARRSFDRRAAAERPRLAFERRVLSPPGHRWEHRHFVRRADGGIALRWLTVDPHLAVRQEPGKIWAERRARRIEEFADGTGGVDPFLGTRKLASLRKQSKAGHSQPYRPIRTTDSPDRFAPTNFELVFSLTAPMLCRFVLHSLACPAAPHLARRRLGRVEPAPGRDFVFPASW